MLLKHALEHKPRALTIEAMDNKLVHCLDSLSRCLLYCVALYERRVEFNAVLINAVELEVDCVEQSCVLRVEVLRQVEHHHMGDSQLSRE